MKKNASVLMLYMRFAVYRLLIVLAALLVLDYAVFAFFDRAGSFMNITAAGLIFAAAFAATVFVCICPIGGKSRFGYTLQRLNVSEKLVFINHCVSNFCAYLILWLVQAAALFLLAKLFVSSSGEPLGPQGLMLEFYRDRILHAILPLGSAEIWARNAVFVFSAALCTAYAPLVMRYEEKKPIFPFIVLVLIMIEFPASLNLGFGGVLVEALGPLAFAIVCAIIALETANTGKHAEEDFETP